MKHIVCFHLFNDYSGSPKVLKSVLNGLLKRGAAVDLVTSGRGGVLDELDGMPGLRRRSYRYRFSDNAAVTMLRYSMIQIYTFFVALGYAFRKDTVFYINTLLPAGPALAGRLCGKRVVYHYHENADVKGAFYKTLAWLMQRLATEIVCVSEYQRSFLKRSDRVTVIPNALPADFVARLNPDVAAAFERKSVLLLGSLKRYKGTMEFFALAGRLQKYSFVLVLNDTRENIDAFIRDNGLAVPGNLRVYPRQEDVAPFYNSSSLVLNLSDKELFIETFGLTALEAMSAGLPVIVPTVGGIAEMVEDGYNGYKADVQDLDKIEKYIDNILTDRELYCSLAENALAFSSRFSEPEMIGRMEKIIC